jgi:hypothetical protein
MRTVLGFLLAPTIPALPLFLLDSTETLQLLWAILLFALFIVPIAIPIHLSLSKGDVYSFSAYLKRGILIGFVPTCLLLVLSLSLGSNFAKSMQWFCLMLFYVFSYSIMTITFFWFFVVKKREFIAVLISLALSLSFWGTLNLFKN